MKEEMDYRDLNRDAWNKRVGVHLNSDFYKLDLFRQGWNSLNEIEKELLGDVRDLDILHFQCHFGQDTLSLARLGARVTGVDISDAAIRAAKALSVEIGEDADFICCDLYDLEHHLERTFDIVYSSYGTVGWLPDLEKWGALINRYLKPGGRLILVDFHPFIWVFDDAFKNIAFRYFNSGPILEEFTGSYADRSAEIKQKTVTWNHSLSEIINSLLSKGLRLRRFDEYDYSPYDIFTSSENSAPGKYRIKGLADKLPLVYALEARKPKKDIA
jgi:SAM-dependent methyltransferase